MEELEYYFADYAAYKEIKQPKIFQKAEDRLRRLLGNIHWEIFKEVQSIKAQTVLEIRPGSGNLLNFLKEHGLEVTGIEIDSNCVERIRKKGISCYLENIGDV